MKHTPEARAIALLEAIVKMDRADRDALPGSVVKLVKQALRILRKRQAAS
jgi:hypothetical protein